MDLIYSFIWEFCFFIDRNIILCDESEVIWLWMQLKCV